MLRFLFYPYNLSLRYASNYLIQTTFYPYIENYLRVRPIELEASVPVTIACKLKSRL
jgi:hypothetical protein